MMKDHYEMYQSLLSRYDAYQEKKQRQTRIIRRTVPVAACFCFTIVLGLGVWHHRASLPDVPVKPEIVTETTTECSESTATTETEMSTITAKAGTATVKATETQPFTTVSAITQTETNLTVVMASTAQTMPVTALQTSVPSVSAAATAPVTSQTARIAETGLANHNKPSETTVTAINLPDEKDSGIALNPEKPSDTTDTEYHGKPTDTTAATTETVTTTTSETQPTEFAEPFRFLADLDVRDALQAIHEPKQQEMAAELTKDGYVFKPVCTDEIALKPYSAAVIFPHTNDQDTMIRYEIIYQNQECRVSFCCADSQIADNWDGMSEYLQARFGRTGNWGLSIRDQVYCIYDADDDGVRQASVRLDQTHYLDVSATASEEEMIEFLKAFQYEQIPIQ